MFSVKILKIRSYLWMLKPNACYDSSAPWLRGGMEFHLRSESRVQLLINTFCRKSLFCLYLTMTFTVKVLATHDSEQVVI